MVDGQGTTKERRALRCPHSGLGLPGAIDSPHQLASRKQGRADAESFSEVQEREMVIPGTDGWQLFRASMPSMPLESRDGGNRVSSVGGP